MLDEAIIEMNKNEFIELVNGIEREGIDKDRLIRQLEGSDFFDAPASAIYHNAFRGGLCEHSLNVYRCLSKLMQAMYPDIKDETCDEEEVKYISTCPYSEDTIRIVSLFHDFDKMNKYERTVKNQKVYSETGSKYDEMGKFDWVAVPGYKKKDDTEVFILGSHGANSVYMTETFIPLSAEEHAAILNHHSNYDNPMLNTTAIFNRYSLACLLHTADMLATYICEKR